MDSNIENIERLEYVKYKIENMNKIQHIEILKILKKYKTVKLNENKTGVYVNISFFNEKIVQELEEYIRYIEDQTILLNVNREIVN